MYTDEKSETDFNIKGDKPGCIRFYGHQTAELFTRELSESFIGALKINYVSDNNSTFPKGFIKASTPGHPWDDTCWTRDCGVFLREMALWGYWNHAVLTVEYLLNHVTTNTEGFFTFPEYLKGREKGSGTEMDGTAAIIIGMVRLWQRLPPEHISRVMIYKFLNDAASPLNYIHKQLKTNPLITGSGEFGGGWMVDGEWYNIVQNSIVRQALIIAAEMEEEAGEYKTAIKYRDDANKLLVNIEKYLVCERDDTWLWCINPTTMKIDEDKINICYTKGTSSINGAGAAYAEAEGLELLADGGMVAACTIATLNKVFESYTLRKEQFEKYGMCTFVDRNSEETFIGYTSWLSYCDCYAAQVMALSDKLDLLHKVMVWIAGATYKCGSPDAAFLASLEKGQAGDVLHDQPSNYWFSERNFSPDWTGHKDIGCGKLNLVNVAEPAKLARLIIGIDDRFGEMVKIIPRLPLGWKGFSVLNWSVMTKAGTVRTSFLFEKKEDGSCSFRISVEDGKEIPYLMIKFPDGKRKIIPNITGDIELVGL